MSVPGMAVGKTGFEKKLDKEIIGEVGFQRYEVNAFGKRIKQIQVDQGQAGKNFQNYTRFRSTTICSPLLEDKAGSVCVMDIYNGDIISLVSSPTYDPNAFVHGVDKNYWNSLISDEKKPLINKAISGLYPPGSTIKTLSCFSALENKIIKPLNTVHL